MIKNRDEKRLDKIYTWINFESQNLVSFEGKHNTDFKVSKWNVHSKLLTAVYLFKAQ